MQNDGRLSNHVIIEYDKQDQTHIPVYHEPTPQPRMVDDWWHDKTQKTGTLTKRGKKYYYTPNETI